VNDDVDIIITWVDGNDPRWKQELLTYRPENSADESSKQKFRDWNTLKYVFRGIERFMPWIRKIHFVTYGHLPEWLDTTNPKLHIVEHKDIFRDISLLPTFNSNAIEFNFLNIDDLAEQFIYFNDDTLVLKETPLQRMFVNGKPQDFLIQTIPRRGWLYYTFFSNVAWRYNINNNVKLINKHFNKKKSITKCKECYYSKQYGLTNIMKNKISNFFRKYHYFEHYHQPQPFLKSVWEEAIAANKSDVEKTISHRFRDKSGITIYLCRYWHLVSGNFIPWFENDFTIRNLQTVKNIKEISSMLLENKYRFVCLNDESSTMDNEDFFKGKQILENTLNQLLPSKSTYEKDL